MKKNLKYILIILGIAVVLGGVLAVLLLTSPSAESAESSATESSSSYISLISRDESSLKAFTVKNESGEYNVTVTEEESSEEDTSSSGSTVSYSYSIEGYESYTAKTSTLSTAAENLYDLSATKEIENPKELSEYGLDSPSATVTASYSDGSSEELVIGDASSSSSGSRYVLYNEKVYLCSINTAFTSGVEYVISPASWSVATASDASDSSTTSELVDSGYLDSFTELSLKIKGGEDIELSFDGKQNVYMLTSPINIMAPDYYVEDFIATIKECSPTGIYKLGATAEDLKACGLSEPEVSISFVLNGERHSAKVGIADGSNRYITIDGDESNIYTIPESKITWINASSTTLRGGLVYMRNITDLSALDITVNGEEADIQFTGEDSDRTVTVNGVAKTYQGVTTSFYNTLISAAIVNMEEPSYSGEAVISVKYSYVAGGSDRLEFFKAESDRYAAVMNGVYVGTVRGSNIDDITKDFKTFMEDDSINTESSETTESSEESAESSADALLPQ